jgi:hypothetical protein
VSPRGYYIINPEETIVMQKTIRLLWLLVSLSLVVWINACAPVSTPVPSDPPGQSAEPGSLSVAEVEELAGFNVLEPGYLPTGVSLEFASFEEIPSPAAVLHFSFVHEQYGNMGALFQIRQEPQTEAPPAALSCGETTEGCEVLQAVDAPVVYRLYESGEGTSTESLEWYASGVFFRLHRMAGEPDKVYKEELLKVVESMK